MDLFRENIRREDQGTWKHRSKDQANDRRRDGIFDDRMHEHDKQIHRQRDGCYQESGKMEVNAD